MKNNISVIVPVFNGEKYLERTLFSEPLKYDIFSDFAISTRQSQFFSLEVTNII